MGKTGRLPLWRQGGCRKTRICQDKNGEAPWLLWPSPGTPAVLQGIQSY